MKWVFLSLLLCFSLFLVAGAEDYTRKDTVSCSYPTMINGRLADWDTVFVVIKTASGSIVDTVGLSHAKPGRWEGWYLAQTLLGGYNRWYHAVYGTDTTGEIYPFSVFDTAAFIGQTAGGCLPPTGNNLITIRVKNSSDNSPIVDCLVQIWNKAMTSCIYYKMTNSTGAMKFTFNNDTLLVRLHKNAWVFTVPETLFINGNEDTTYFGTLFNPGLPPSADLCRVYGYIGDITGVNDSNYTITFENEKKPLRYGTVIISPYSRSDRSDANGYWYLDLYPNSLLNPNNTRYKVSVKDLRNNKDVLFTGGSPYIYITVPDLANWEMTW